MPHYGFAAGTGSSQCPGVEPNKNLALWKLSQRPNVSFYGWVLSAHRGRSHCQYELLICTLVQSPQEQALQWSHSGSTNWLTLLLPEEPAPGPALSLLDTRRKVQLATVGSKACSLLFSAQSWSTPMTYLQTAKRLRGFFWFVCLLEFKMVQAVHYLLQKLKVKSSQ